MFRKNGWVRIFLLCALTGGFFLRTSLVMALELRVAEVHWKWAKDEHGRHCFLRPDSPAKLVSQEEDGELVWILTDTPDEADNRCGNGTRFRINLKNKTFIQKDFGLKEVLKYYAKQSCRVVGDTENPRQLLDEETETMARCFMEPNFRERILENIAIFLSNKYLDAKFPVSGGLGQACTRDLYLEEQFEISCPWDLLGLGSSASLKDVVVIKQGDHQLKGTGSTASTYVLDPNFKGSVTVAGHSRVFHLPGQKCKDGHFKNCRSVEAK